MPERLLPKTRRLLSKCDRPLQEIADGAGVGFEWLRSFKGSEHDFGVGKVQKLHDYLQRESLQRRQVRRNRIRA